MQALSLSFAKVPLFSVFIVFRFFCDPGKMSARETKKYHAEKFINNLYDTI